MANGYKKLNTDELEKLQTLEKKWGHCIIAYENGPVPAELSGDELQDVQALEKDLGAVLVDYAC